MALYFYQALSREGKKLSGYVDAGSAGQVRDQLTTQQLYPITIELATEKKSASFDIRSLFKPRVSPKDIIFFTKQLAVLLKSGIPLLQALELLIEQTEGALKSIVIELKDGIKEGRSLADGLSNYPKIFDTTYVQLVKAGEASGRLETILDRLTTYLERSADIRKKINSAMRMPLIQLGVILIVVAILLTVVVPQIATTFSSQNMELPFATRLLMGASNAVLNHYIIILIVLTLIVGIFFIWKSTERGALQWDAFILKIPLIGYFARMGAIVQFSRTLGMLIEGGVNLAEALQIVTKVVDNKVLVATLNDARENIIKQGKIAEYLKRTNLFPAVAIYLINTGEQSGQLDKMLLIVAEYYDAELREYADGLAATLGPIMMVIMGVVVGFVVLAIAIPIQKMTQMGDLGKF